jgi:hypothetical protein
VLPISVSAQGRNRQTLWCYTRWYTGAILGTYWVHTAVYYRVPKFRFMVILGACLEVKGSVVHEPIGSAFFAQGQSNELCC